MKKQHGCRTAMLCIAVLFLSSCAQTGSSTRSKAASGTDGRNDLVVLLPKPNGKIGGVIVRAGEGQSLLLDTAYAGAEVSHAGNLAPVTYNRSRTRREFGTTLDALPGRPTSFLVYFLEGRDDLIPESEKEILAFFTEIDKRPDPEILIIGHADAVGTDSFNDQLSRQRAQKVKDDLVRRGIAADRIAVAGRGNREPLVVTAKNVREPQNRRVEISVR
ncbi:MAG: OmpA family protein [Burkholderiales bacterium]